MTVNPKVNLGNITMPKVINDIAKNMPKINQITPSYSANGLYNMNALESEITDSIVLDDYQNQKQLYSEQDNIEINRLSTFMVELHNTLKNDSEDPYAKGDLYYKFYCEYLKGRTIKSIIKDDPSSDRAHYAEVDDIKRANEILESLDIPVEEREKFISKLNEMLLDKDNSFGLSTNNFQDDVLNSKISEVISSASGYDALVLENENSYFVVNSCTNDKSPIDLGILANVLARQLCGNYDLYTSIVDKALPSGILDDVICLNSEQIKDCYENQIKENMELIEKYSAKSLETGKKVELRGYSLGGGIQLTSYAKLLEKDNNLNIGTVEVFNPFISYLEQNVSGQQLLQELLDDKNVCIYAGTYDAVSHFNCIFGDFVKNNQVVFVNTGEPANIKTGDEINIFELLGAHGYVTNDSYDESGNLVKLGQDVSINRIVDLLFGDSSIDSTSLESYSDELDYGFIWKQIFDTINIPEDLKITTDIGPFKNCQIDLGNLVSDMKQYFIDNGGDYSYEGLCQTLSHSIVQNLDNLIWDNAYTLTDDNKSVQQRAIDAGLIGMFGSELSYWISPKLEKSIYYALTNNKEAVLDMVNNMMLNNFDIVEDYAIDLLWDALPNDLKATISTIMTVKNTIDSIFSGLKNGFNWTKDQVIDDFNWLKNLIGL